MTLLFPPGSEYRLRELCKELLGPVHKSASTSWEATTLVRHAAVSVPSSYEIPLYLSDWLYEGEKLAQNLSFLCCKSNARDRRHRLQMPPHSPNCLSCFQGLRKRDLLREVLPVIGENLRFQRLFTEYQDQLELLRSK